jgi:hypothetical protein
MKNAKFNPENETPHFSKEALKDSIKLRKFAWIGWNKHFQEYIVSEPLTTYHLRNRNYPSFFENDNDNCVFVMEIFEGDTLTYYSKNSVDRLECKVEDGEFIGQGAFTAYPLEIYFNSPDFSKIERQV